MIYLKKMKLTPLANETALLPKNTAWRGSVPIRTAYGLFSAWKGKKNFKNQIRLP